jgi:hypothetical protein
MTITPALFIQTSIRPKRLIVSRASRATLFRLSYVGGDDERCAAGPAHFTGDLFEQQRATRRHDHVGTSGGKRHGGAAPETARGSGDHDSLASKSFLPVSRMKGLTQPAKLSSKRIVPPLRM